jgi:hypothetical protein
MSFCTSAATGPTFHSAVGGLWHVLSRTAGRRTIESKGSRIPGNHLVPWRRLSDSGRHGAPTSTEEDFQLVSKRPKVRRYTRHGKRHGARWSEGPGNLPAPLTVTSIALIKGAVESWTIRFRLWPLKKSDKVIHNQQANSGTEASRLE